MCCLGTLTGSCISLSLGSTAHPHRSLGAGAQQRGGGLLHSDTGVMWGRDLSVKSGNRDDWPEGTEPLQGLENVGMYNPRMKGLARWCGSMAFTCVPSIEPHDRADPTCRRLMDCGGTQATPARCQVRLHRHGMERLGNALIPALLRAEWDFLVGPGKLRGLIPQKSSSCHISCPV